MKTQTFYAGSNRSGNLLHIETDGCIVNIRVGLTDMQGRQVTHVEVLPDDHTRGGDWVVLDKDNMPSDTQPTVVRVARDEKD